METESFNEEEGIWVIHKSLPHIENHVFHNGADSGCLSVIEGIVYSVGKEIISLEWTTLKVGVITLLEESAQAEGCVGLRLKNGDYGFFFLSGDWFSLKLKSWSKFNRPDPAFNIVKLGNKPTILGTANLNRTCEDKNTNCNGKTLYGDKRVVQFDIEKNHWEMVGSLKHARLGYSSAVEVPGYVCDMVEYTEDFDDKSDDFDSFIEPTIQPSTSDQFKKTNFSRNSDTTVNEMSDERTLKLSTNSVSDILKEEMLIILSSCIFMKNLLKESMK